MTTMKTVDIKTYYRRNVIIILNALNTPIVVYIVNHWNDATENSQLNDKKITIKHNTIGDDKTF